MMLVSIPYNFRNEAALAVWCSPAEALAIQLSDSLDKQEVGFGRFLPQRSCGGVFGRLIEAAGCFQKS